MKAAILADTGQDLYLYPIDPDNRPLSQWSTHRIQVIERGFPNLGLYEFDTEDVDINFDYAIFANDAVPTNWTVALRQLSFEAQRLEQAQDQARESIEESIDDVTKLLTGGKVVQDAPVTATGVITGPIVIGDDYLAASGRAFVWYFQPQDYAIENAKFWFGGEPVGMKGAPGWLVEGTVEADTLEGDPVWKCTAELTEGETSVLERRIYDWSAQLREGTSKRVTKRIGNVRVVRGFTPNV